MVIGTVFDMLEIKGRGLLITIEATNEQLPRHLKVKSGDPVEIRVNGEVVLRSKIVGFAHLPPPTLTRTFGFLLPGDLTKANVPLGAELWSTD
jgi:hypothetical protein